MGIAHCFFLETRLTTVTSHMTATTQLVLVGVPTFEKPHLNMLLLVKNIWSQLFTFLVYLF